MTLCWCTCGMCYLAETARCLWGCRDGVCDIVLVYMRCYLAQTAKAFVML